MEERKIICIEGELKDSEILMHPGDQVVVGREPRFANLVFRDMTISRKHCVVELNEQGVYYVTDYSECGLIAGENIMFEKGTRTLCPKGTVLFIGKAGTKIMLG